MTLEEYRRDRRVRLETLRDIRVLMRGGPPVSIVLDLMHIRQKVQLSLAKQRYFWQLSTLQSATK